MNVQDRQEEMKSILLSLYTYFFVFIRVDLCPSVVQSDDGYRCLDPVSSVASM